MPEDKNEEKLRVFGKQEVNVFRRKTNTGRTERTRSNPEFSGDKKEAGLRGLDHQTEVVCFSVLVCYKFYVKQDNRT